MLLHVAMPLAPPRMLLEPRLPRHDGGLRPVGVRRQAPPRSPTSSRRCRACTSGWALLIALVVVRTAQQPAGAGWSSLHPVITTLVVVVTANHYWVDAVVVALLLGLVLLVTPRPAAVPPSRTVAAGDRPRGRCRRAGRTVTVARPGRPTSGHRDDEDRVAGRLVRAGRRLDASPRRRPPGRMPVTTPVTSPPRPRTPADCES